MHFPPDILDICHVLVILYCTVVTDDNGPWTDMNIESKLQKIVTVYFQKYSYMKKHILRDNFFTKLENIIIRRERLSTYGAIYLQKFVLFCILRISLVSKNVSQ